MYIIKPSRLQEISLAGSAVKHGFDHCQLYTKLVRQDNSAINTVHCGPFDGRANNEQLEIIMQAE